MTPKAQPRFHLEAFESILEQNQDIATPTDLARLAGISPGTLHDITHRDEAGRTRRTPSIAVIKKLSRALNVPVRALLTNPDSYDPGLDKAKAAS